MSKSLRIIGGSAKGRLLKAPDTDKCRPTTEKTREAVAATLRYLIDADTRVLDLYAGSGALGLELCSLGAGSCVFVDQVTYSIEDNVEKLGWKEKCKVWRGDGVRFLKTHKGLAFDIILIDPPYAKENLLDETLAAVFECKIIAPGGLIVAEHAPQYKPQLPEGLQHVRSKRYGSTNISYYAVRGHNIFKPAQFQVQEFT